MGLTVLGLSGALDHDASAALLVDGRIVAAAEEERFSRVKHAPRQLPLQAARYCLDAAGLQPSQIDRVAIPLAPVSLASPGRWHYARRHWYAPDRALDALCNGNRRYRRYRRRVLTLLAELGMDAGMPLDAVPHHLAHASSAYHLAGFDGDAAILSLDGRGEYASTFFGRGRGRKIERIHELFDPDSLAGLYGAMTEYLGFEMLDGEYKVMGMAPYGDARRFDFSRLASVVDGDLRVNTRLVNTVGLRRHRHAGRGRYYGAELVRWLGPPREGDSAAAPWIDYAASVQALFEAQVLALVDHWLAPVLRQTRRLAFVGGGALNVKLNQRLLARPDVDELFVQPAAGDAGTALGAASFVSEAHGVVSQPLQHVYLGPQFDIDQVRAACARCPTPLHVQTLTDAAGVAAAWLAAGHPVAWFQGRMEFGPRALGARSILGSPSCAGIAERINAQIKFRELWRPFCPSLLEELAPEIIGQAGVAPFMTVTYDVAAAWRERIAEVVHVDGTARVQTVGRDHHPRYRALLEALARRTGVGVVLNTSLNRRGEPLVCTPDDALAMFGGCDLQALVIEDLLITKAPVDPWQPPVIQDSAGG